MMLNEKNNINRFRTFVLFRNFVANTGFTMIELLVVIFVSALLATVVTVNFRQLRISQETQAGAANLISKIREVQSNVLVGKYITGTSAPRAYVLSFSAASPSYTVSYNLIDSNGSNTTTTLETVTAGTNVQIQQVLVGGAARAPVTLRIEAPYGHMSVDGAYQTLQIDLQHATGAVKSILVEPVSGKIGLQ